MIAKVRIQGYRAYVDETVEFQAGTNIIVGSNESGKSTLLEAITLALTCRVSNRRADEELNPHWFNTATVTKYFEDRDAGVDADPPEIRIEVFLDSEDESIQRLRGKNNSLGEDVPGICLAITPDPETTTELVAALKDEATTTIPHECYRVEWHSFNDPTAQLTRTPRGIAVAMIDSSTVRTSAGVDYHVRQALSDYVQPDEKRAISQSFRELKSTLTSDALGAVNARLESEHSGLHDKPVTLAMDQSSRTSWQATVVPHVSRIPFSMAGQGQQVSIKIALAMRRESDNASIVMLEEPENHLSYSALRKLVKRVETLAGENQQLLITTHSSYVLNRLGLDRLVLLSDAKSGKFDDLAADTINYFRKLPGYDTLRLVLAEKVILVEGPSDEIIVERLYLDKYGCAPLDHGIDVISMRGLSLDRCLALCAALNKRVAATRDIDDETPEDIRLALKDHLDGVHRELFVAEVGTGATLEPQIINCNDESLLREILEKTARANILKTMTNAKTESAIKIADSDKKIVGPTYLMAAIEFVHDA